MHRQNVGMYPLNPLFSCKLAVYIGVYTFSFCADRIPGRFPTPSYIHSFSCRRKRTNQEKGGRPKLPFLWECLSWLNGRNSLRSDKRPFLTPCHSFSLCGHAAQPVIPVTGRFESKCEQLQIAIYWEIYLRFCKTSDKIFLNELQYISYLFSWHRIQKKFPSHVCWRYFYVFLFLW